MGQVPDANLRAGVFPSPIVDPITKVPFPNNTIPASLIDPTSAKILNLWPLPNNPGVAARNFIFNAVPSAHDNRDWVVGRVDYNINERNTLYGRYLFDNEITHNPPTLPNNIGANERDLRAQAAGGHYLKTITPHIVNDLSYGYMRYHNVIQTAFSYKENLISQFGITNTLSDNNPLFWGTPGVSIPGYLGTDSGNPNYRTSTIHEAQDGLGWNHGRHFLKFGGDVRIVDTTMLYTGGNGSWSFANSYSGNNFADFLLGYPSQISKTSRRPVGYNRVKYLGLYAQDDFKLSRNVTLNLGMRYEIETIPDDPTHSMVGFDPTDGSLLVSSRIASAQAVKDFYANVRPDIKYRFIDANAPVNTDTNNVAARLGLAWQIAKGTTVRGGYGMFYGSPQTSSYLASGSNDFAPNTLRPIWTSNPGTPSFKGYNPDGTLSPEAALQSAALTLFPFLAGRVSGNSVVYDTGRSFPYPLVQQFLFSLQHQVGSNFLVEVQYFGSRTQHLIGNDNVQVTTPGPGAVAARLPYPGLARIENTAAWHRAWYNGVAVKAQQRLSHGLSYLVSYTLSKSLDDASTLNDDPEWTDSRNKLNGRGPSDFDVRNRLVGSFQYELPVGRGRHFGGAWPRLADALLGGWGVRGIASFQTGFEYSPTMAISRVGACLAACVARPERVGNGNLDKSVRNINGFWDINAFAFPPAFTLGSPSGRNVLYGPGVNNWDLDIYKQFRIGERQSLEFRYEAFNAFNHAQFNAPPANLEAPATFGKITGTAAPRISQLVLRYQF
ncbi:MAG TPA: TonB-dependent receptor [Bryobacteraceae bacterium]|nr:TonB-dependent receptor [Bryobacteraceae bacterium]